MLPERDGGRVLADEVSVMEPGWAVLKVPFWVEESSNLTFRWPGTEGREGKSTLARTSGDHNLVGTTLSVTVNNCAE